MAPTGNKTTASQTEVDDLVQKLRVLRGSSQMGARPKQHIGIKLHELLLLNGARPNMESVSQDDCAVGEATDFALRVLLSH